MTIQSDKIINRAVPTPRDKGDKATAPKNENDNGSSLKLELGGKNPVFLKGDWQHLDIQHFPHTEYTTDSFASIPFDDNSVEEIFAKRIIQKLSKKDAIQALQEWLRALAPTGSIKIISIDIKKVMGKYLQTFEEKYLDLLFGIQTDKTEFYLFGYSPDTLKKMMIDAGFVNVRESTPSVDYFDPQIEFILEADKPKKK